MAEVVKFVKATLFGRKKGKKDKKGIKAIESAHGASIHVTPRRSSAGRSAYEYEDVAHQRHSFYHTDTKRPARRTAKSMACGEQLDEPASDSDEEIVAKPKKVVFSGHNRKYSFTKEASSSPDVAREFERMSMRSKRSRSRNGEDKDMIIEKLKNELKTAQQKICQQEYTIDRSERKYDNLKHRYREVKRKENEDTLNQSTMYNNMTMMGGYQQQPQYFNQPIGMTTAMPPYYNIQQPFYPPNMLQYPTVEQFKNTVTPQIPTPPSTTQYDMSPMTNTSNNEVMSTGYNSEGGGRGSVPNLHNFQMSFGQTLPSVPYGQMVPNSEMTQKSSMDMKLGQNSQMVPTAPLVPHGQMLPNPQMTPNPQKTPNFHMLQDPKMAAIVPPIVPFGQALPQLMSFVQTVPTSQNGQLKGEMSFELPQNPEYDPISPSDVESVKNWPGASEGFATESFKEDKENVQ
ncbi:unnamed protein product [Bursaphelenchus okinawaensis]|uniref:Uncharacterized protein n=1 Tax=Bursaphelenchus okinawaensis TaxID=465554 RepID=A0A811KCK9_9BILA|nr:unnamed protein product [Bursaphelenchus okinawaensis]CAG9099086.1 unnamed protein product [Bursaphelenchus okinawaensis]